MNKISQRRRAGRVEVFLLLAFCMGLGTTSFLMWSGKTRATIRADRLAQLREQASDENAELNRQLEILKARISSQNLATDMLLDSIAQDINAHGSGAPDETYQDVLSHMADKLENLKKELRSEQRKRDQANQQLNTAQSALRETVKVAEDAAQEARTELVHERTKFLRDLDGKDQEIAAVMDKANTLALRLEREERDKTKIRKELLRQVTQLQIMLQEVRTEHSPDVLVDHDPDGEIVRSSAATKTAWVNIGSKHGVKPMLTFTIQSSNHHGNPYDNPKAKLEIVKVIGPTMSEARIYGQRITRPVIRGDRIYNPFWNQGKAMRFAIAGRLDIDGDGQDDRNLVRQIIRTSGGQVDAELQPGGSIGGAVTVKTDFFIRGEHPSLFEADAKHTIQQMAAMEKTAKSYGVVVINLQKFLNMVGYSRLQTGRSKVSLR